MCKKGTGKEVKGGKEKEKKGVNIVNVRRKKGGGEETGIGTRQGCVPGKVEKGGSL